jgi:hypothetical protein
MEEKIVSLKVNDNIEQTSASVKSLRTQLREAQQEVAQLSDKFGATSKEAVEAAKRAAQLKDAIGDAKALTDAFNPDAKFKAVSASLTGVAGGFSAVTGAMGLFGKESEEVEQAILKVQSAMALASGIQAVGESIDSFKQLGAVIRATSLFQKASTAAQWLWNAAMAANPIGAIVAAVTALIAAGYLLIKMFVDSSEANEAAAKATAKNTLELERNKKAVEANSKKVNEYNKYQYDLAKASGASAEELRKLALKHKDEEIALNLKNAMIARSTFLRERDTLAALRANDASDEVIKNQEKLTQDLFKEFDKQRQGYYNSKNEKLALVRSQNVEERQAQTEANKKSSDDRKEAAKKERDELKAERRKKEEEAIAYGKASIEAELIRQREASTKLFKDKAEAEDKYESEQEAKRDARIKNAFDKNLAFNLKIVSDNEEARQKDAESIKMLEEAEIALQDAKVNAAQAAFNILGQLAGQNKTLQRAAILGEAAIGIFRIIKNTQAANAAVIAKYALIPGGQILAAKEILANKINAGVGIATTTAAAARALGSIGAGGSAGGGGGAGGSAAPSSMGGSAASAAPQFNVVGAGGANQLAQAMATNQAPIKAFVVSNDVTTAQSLDRNIVKSATLG